MQFFQMVFLFFLLDMSGIWNKTHHRNITQAPPVTPAPTVQVLQYTLGSRWPG